MEKGVGLNRRAMLIFRRVHGYKIEEDGKWTEEREKQNRGNPTDGTLGRER